MPALMGGRSHVIVSGCLKLTSVLYPLLGGVITRVLPLPSFVLVVIHGVILPGVAVSVRHSIKGTMSMATDV